MTAEGRGDRLNHYNFLTVQKEMHLSISRKHVYEMVR